MDEAGVEGWMGVGLWVYTQTRNSWHLQSHIAIMPGRSRSRSPVPSRERGADRGTERDANKARDRVRDRERERDRGDRDDHRRPLPPPVQRRDTEPAHRHATDSSNVCEIFTYTRTSSPFLLVRRPSAPLKPLDPVDRVKACSFDVCVYGRGADGQLSSTWLYVICRR